MNIVKRLVICVHTFLILASDGVQAGPSKCLRTEKLINPIADDRRIMAYVSASDADIVQNLSPDHFLTGITACKNDKIITYVQLQYATLNKETGRVENIVSGVEHGEIGSKVTCTQKSLITPNGGIKQFLVRYDTDILQMLFLLEDKSVIQLGFEGRANVGGPFQFDNRKYMFFGFDS